MPEKNHETPQKHLPGEKPQYKVVSHSLLFYWWPVWALGFVMAAISFASGTRLAVVPEGSTVKAMSRDNGSQVFELTVPLEHAEFLDHAATVPSGVEVFPSHIAQYNTLHLVYAFVLLLVIVATTVTLRGLWSVVNAMAILVIALTLYILGWWGVIIVELGRLHIYVSAAGYLFTSLVLFLYWLATTFVFDQRRFILFTPGQLIVHREIGDTQSVYDTSGVSIVKRRNDFIRHRLLGFNSGDLLVSTADGRHEFELPNVLFADAKIREIAEAMKTDPSWPISDMSSGQSQLNAVRAEPAGGALDRNSKSSAIRMPAAIQQVCSSSTRGRQEARPS